MVTFDVDRVLADTIHGFVRLARRPLALAGARGARQPFAGIPDGPSCSGSERS